MKVTDLYYLVENLRYILSSEHMYFPAISPFLSDWVTYYVYNAIFFVVRYLLIFYVVLVTFVIFIYL